jgi:hypothetical protein
MQLIHLLAFAVHHERYAAVLLEYNKPHRVRTSAFVDHVAKAFYAWVRTMPISVSPVDDLAGHTHVTAIEFAARMRFEYVCVLRA